MHNKLAVCEFASLTPEETEPTDAHAAAASGSASHGSELQVTEYSQVLCGQVSCWDTQIGHLLGDRAGWLPGSSRVHLHAFNEETAVIQ